MRQIFKESFSCTREGSGLLHTDEVRAEENQTVCSPEPNPKMFQFSKSFSTGMLYYRQKLCTLGLCAHTHTHKTNGHKLEMSAVSGLETCL